MIDSHAGSASSHAPITKCRTAVAPCRSCPTLNAATAASRCAPQLNDWLRDREHRLCHLQLGRWLTIFFGHWQIGANADDAPGRPSASEVLVVCANLALYLFDSDRESLAARVGTASASRYRACAELMQSEPAQCELSVIVSNAPPPPRELGNGWQTGVGSRTGWRGIFRAALARSSPDVDGNPSGASDAGACAWRGGGRRRPGLRPRPEETVQRWTRRGQYAPRAARVVLSCLDPYKDWLACRAPEVGYNATVLFRELQERGFRGSVIIVRRGVVPLRKTATPPAATVRYETAPSAQAQVDFGQTRVWIADAHEVVQIFEMTLGFSRRCFAVAFRRQRLREWIAGHEQAFEDRVGSQDFPKSITVDHGTEFPSKAVEAWAFYRGVELDFTRPGKPTDNGQIESFNGRLRDECLNVHPFLSLDHAKTIIEAWRRDYNDHRPHSSLGDLTPTEFAHRPEHHVTTTER